jgi:hypothetical protein
MPTVIDATVVNQAYDTSGNGGRKLVRLSNGWLVAVLNDTTNKMLKIYKSTDNGTTWTQVCYISRIRDSSNNPFSGASVASFGTKCVVITPYYNSGNTHAIGAFVFDVETIENIDLYGTAYAYDISLENGNYAIGATSVVINNAVTEIHVAWSSKNITYPNSFNIRYAKGTINADGSVTWGAVEQVTFVNNSSAPNFMTNPSIFVYNGNPTIAVAYDFGNLDKRIGILTKSFTTKEAMSSYVKSDWGYATVYDGGSYAQSSPSACVAPNGRIWVAWHGTDSTDNTVENIRVAYSDDGGVTWSSMTKLTSGNSYYQRVPSITVNKNNEVFVLWFGRDASDGYDDIRMIKYSGGSWGSISVVSAGTTNHKGNPSALYDTTLDFSTPLFIYKDQQNNKVGFYGTWVVTNISVQPGSLGQKTSADRTSLLTYSITTDGTMSDITEKINGVTIATRTNPTSGQQFTVSLSQAQWDAIKYGKYYPTTLNVISMSASDWEQGAYTGNVGSPIGTNTLTTRIRTKSPVPAMSTEYTISLTLSYLITVFEVDNSGIITRISSWLGDGDKFTPLSSTKNLYFVVRKADDSAISQATVSSARPKAEYVTFLPNTLTIEMGSDVWTYTFNKQLNTNDDILSAVKAAQDTQTTFLPAIKAQLGAAIRAKGGTVNDTDAWSAFVSAVANMQVKRWASGTVTSTSSYLSFEFAGSTTASNSYYVTVSGLSFKPSLIILQTSNVSGYSYLVIYNEINDGIYSKTVKLSQYDIDSYVASSHTFKGDKPNATVTNGGFTLPVYGNSTMYNWIAFE